MAAVNSAAPFAHGSWLAAYLVLVAGVSQVLLGVGRRALLVREPPRRLIRAQVLLWNAGSVAVPAGVLGDATLLVTAGSLALLRRWPASRQASAGCRSMRVPSAITR